MPLGLIDGLEAVVELLEEGETEARLLNVVVLGCLVQFSFGELVEVRSIHSFQLGPRVPKHIAGRAPGAGRRVPISVAAISFLRPEALILLIGQSFEALKEPLGQPCPRLRIQLEDFGLEVVDTHTPILPQRSEADLGGPTLRGEGGERMRAIGPLDCVVGEPVHFAGAHPRPICSICMCLRKSAMFRTNSSSETPPVKPLRQRSEATVPSTR